MDRQSLIKTNFLTIVPTHTFASSLRYKIDLNEREFEVREIISALITHTDKKEGVILFHYKSIQDIIINTTAELTLPINNTIHICIKIKINK